MTAMAADRRRWALAGVTALAAHGAIAAIIAGGTAHPPRPIPEPVVLIELAAIGDPAPQPATAQPASPEPEPPRPEPAPVAAAAPPPPRPEPAPAPAMPAPSPPPAIVAPAIVAPATPSPPAPAEASPLPPAPPAATTVPAPASASPAPAASADPRARKQEADYFALLSAHLNRRKTYPVEARRAREQGVVTVRFTVDRDGNVSDVMLKRGSGHAILDEETLALVQRVAPMPRMPATMQRERLTLSLPIEYSLRTN